MKTRLLSSREEVRIGTALYVALERIEERKRRGEEPRADGLFEPGGDPRGALEGTLLTAARSYDELKVPYIGAFYSSFVFADDVSIDAAHFMLGQLDRLTYRQFAALGFFAAADVRPELERIQVAAEEEGAESSPTLLSELFELANLGLLGAWQGDPEEVLTFGETYATFGGGMPMLATHAGLLALTTLGRRLATMADMESIPDEDRRLVAARLAGSTI